MGIKICLLTSFIFFEIILYAKSKSVISKVIPVGKSVQVPGNLTENDILTSKFRNAFARATLWPNGIVPYTIDTMIQSDSSRYEALKSAFAEYHSRTCIKWIRKSNSDTNYVKFVDNGPLYCASYVGMIGGAQVLSVGQGCERSIGVILHEMAHALSFMHEHTRPDRDQNVKIVTDKILETKTVMFDKLAASDSNLQNFSYDYSSIMHYGPTAFSKDGSVTIITTDTKAQSIIGQRDGFSVCDLEKINKLYGCTQKLTKDPSCQSTPETNKVQCPDDTSFASECSKATSNQKLCAEKPGLYMFYCRKSCNNCDSSYCKDTTLKGVDCSRVRLPCDVNSAYSCPKTCKWCS